MLDFFKTFLSDQPDALFLIITNDPSNDALVKAGLRGIPRDHIIVTQAPRKLMPLFIAVGNATLFFIKPVFSKKASSPVKQGEAMGMGVPIVCNAGIGDTDMIVRDSNAGVVISSFDDNEYKRAATELISTNFDAQSIRNGAMKFYALHQGVQRYLNVYKLLQRE